MIVTILAHSDILLAVYLNEVSDYAHCKRRNGMSDILPYASNPYFSKAMIQDPKMFFGRADLLSRVYEMVARRQCASLVGPRGIGKSSFLWYTSLPESQALFPFDLNRHIFVLLDLRGYLRKT